MLKIAAYLLTVPLANWLIGNVGTFCIPNGPCTIPVAPGVSAPSGVLVIGAALVLRDLVQRERGAAVSIACILGGSALSLFVAPPALAAASATAFLLSELADFAVYTPIAKRNFALAVLLSCMAGGVVDSAAFLWLAFGSLNFILGQVIGKIYAALIFLAVRRGRYAL